MVYKVKKIAADYSAYTDITSNTFIQSIEYEGLSRPAIAKIKSNINLDIGDNILIEMIIGTEQYYPIFAGKITAKKDISINQAILFEYEISSRMRNLLNATIHERNVNNTLDGFLYDVINHGRLNQIIKYNYDTGEEITEGGETIDGLEYMLHVWDMSLFNVKGDYSGTVDELFGFLNDKMLVFFNTIPKDDGKEAVIGFAPYPITDSNGEYPTICDPNDRIDSETIYFFKSTGTNINGMITEKSVDTDRTYTGVVVEMHTYQRTIIDDLVPIQDDGTNLYAETSVYPVDQIRAYLYNADASDLEYELCPAYDFTVEKVPYKKAKIIFDTTVNSDISTSRKLKLIYTGKKVVRVIKESSTAKAQLGTSKLKTITVKNSGEPTDTDEELIKIAEQLAKTYLSSVTGGKTSTVFVQPIIYNGQYNPVFASAGQINSTCTYSLPARYPLTGVKAVLDGENVYVNRIKYNGSKGIWEFYIKNIRAVTNIGQALTEKTMELKGLTFNTFGGSFAMPPKSI